MKNNTSNYPLSDEHKAAISNSLTGRSRGEFSDEWKANLSEALAGEKNPMYGKTHSDASKEKMREKATGRVHSPEMIEARCAKLRGKVRERKICPHCNKEVAVNIFAQYHGDKCKTR